MKEIRLPYSIEMAEEGRLDMSALPTRMGQARKLRLQIIDSAVHIENSLREIICRHFFEPMSSGEKDFQQWILDSDSCSFAAKRKVLTAIIEKRNLVTGQAKDRFEKVLGDVLKYRNAFAHGRFRTDCDRVWISYFEGKSKEQELSEDFLLKVEGTFNEADSSLATLLRNLMQDIRKERSTARPNNVKEEARGGQKHFIKLGPKLATIKDGKMTVVSQAAHVKIGARSGAGTEPPA